VTLANLSKKEKENALNEVRILASIRNPNIIGYKEVFLDERSNSMWYVIFDEISLTLRTNFSYVLK